MHPMRKLLRRSLSGHPSHRRFRVMATRGAAWSRLEVEATVASYFTMLELGIRGEPFSKTAHRNSLLPLLNNRSPGAVERKHQNISAILIEEGIPYITGYKPLGNYQNLLREVVLEQLGDRFETRAVIEAEVLRAPPPPTFDDILAALVDPPAPRPGMNRAPRTASPRVRAPADYLLMEARNQALGIAGERFVLDLERARLEAAGHGALAARVSHVSIERGDGLGYDILSFEPDTQERLIEVKTTRFGEYTPFYVTSNELEVSRRERVRYHLYRVHSFGPAAKLFTVSGPLDDGFHLDPSAYRARIN